MDCIVSAMPFFYGASEEAPNTALVSVELKDEVRHELLSDVVSRVMVRYPYFMVRPVTRGNEYLLEENPEPVAVVAGTGSVTLGGREANGHLLAFSCVENRICLSFFHGLADGAGIFPLLRSVLYYYCRERYGEKLDAAGIRLIGSPIPDEEREDPYPESVGDGITRLGGGVPGRRDSIFSESGFRKTHLSNIRKQTMEVRLPWYLFFCTGPFRGSTRGRKNQSFAAWR